jgi:hypothetical protein
VNGSRPVRPTPAVHRLLLAAGLVAFATATATTAAGGRDLDAGGSLLVASMSNLSFFALSVALVIVTTSDFAAVAEGLTVNVHQHDFAGEAGKGWAGAERLYG